MHYKDYKTAHDRLSNTPNRHDIVKDIALGIAIVAIMFIINHFLPR